MNDERDEILDELRALIAVEPTPAFEARVRREVEERGARRLSWAWAVAGVSAVVVLFLVAAGAQRGRDEPARAAVNARTAVPVWPSQPTTEAVGPAPRIARPGSRPAAARGAKPEVLVPPDSARAFASLVSAARRGEIPTSLWRNDASVVPAMITLAPIEIPPSEIPLAVPVAGIDAS